MKFLSASDAMRNGKITHLQCGKGDISDIVLLPGDPGRVDWFKELLEDYREVARNREFVVGRGTFDGCDVTICSTGIGSGSTEIAVMELIALGAKALIRIGGTGTIREEIPCGDMIINTAAMRLGGASSFYAPPEYPAAASFEVIACLREACEEQEQAYHMGYCGSVNSYYAGQGRRMHNGKLLDMEPVLERYQQLGLLNLEMEAETIFTLGSLHGVLTGSICSVHCNRVTDLWQDDFQPVQHKMCTIALNGAKKLALRIG